VQSSSQIITSSKQDMTATWQIIHIDVPSVTKQYDHADALQFGK